MSQKRSITALMAEGRQRRQVDQSKVQELRDLYESVQNEKKKASGELPTEGEIKGFGSVTFMIIISLAFLSLHLSEPIIDWTMVGIVIGGNVVLDVILLQPPVTWINYVLLVLLNLVVAIRTSDIYVFGNYLYAHPKLIALLAAFNAGLLAFLRLVYMKRPLDAAPEPLEKADEHLRQFYAEYQREEREEMIRFLLISFNMLTLIASVYDPLTAKRLVERCGL